MWFLGVCAQLHPTVYGPMDCSPPGSSAHGNFPGKNNAMGAISYSRGSSCPRNQTLIFCLAERFFITSITSEASCNCLKVHDYINVQSVWSDGSRQIYGSLQGLFFHEEKPKGCTAHWGLALNTSSKRLFRTIFVFLILIRMLWK